MCKLAFEAMRAAKFGRIVNIGSTVNAIAPGYVDTDMVRAVPEDVIQKIIVRVPRAP